MASQKTITTKNGAGIELPACSSSSERACPSWRAELHVLDSEPSAGSRCAARVPESFHRNLRLPPSSQRSPVSQIGTRFPTNSGPVGRAARQKAVDGFFSIRSVTGQDAIELDDISGHLGKFGPLSVEGTFCRRDQQSEHKGGHRRDEGHTESPRHLRDPDPGDARGGSCEAACRTTLLQIHPRTLSN